MLRPPCFFGQLARGGSRSIGPWPRSRANHDQWAAEAAYDIPGTDRTRPFSYFDLVRRWDAVKHAAVPWHVEQSVWTSIWFFILARCVGRGAFRRCHINGPLASPQAQRPGDRGTRESDLQGSKPFTYIPRPGAQHHVRSRGSIRIWYRARVLHHERIPSRSSGTGHGGCADRAERRPRRRGGAAPRGALSASLGIGVCEAAQPPVIRCGTRACPSALLRTSRFRRRA